MRDMSEDLQKGIADSLQALAGQKEMLARVVEFFPYPIQVFSADGTVRMINKAGLDMIGIKNVESHVGVYNVFNDPIVRGLGAMDRVRQVLTGKTVFLTDFNAPYQDMIRYFNIEDRDIQ